MTTLEPITPQGQIQNPKLLDGEEYADVIERMIIENGDPGLAENFETNHYFSKGVYVREVVMPADNIVVGHRHTEDGMNVMLTGKMALIVEPGKLEYLEAPMTFESKAGTRKAAYIIEDVIWQNIFATEERDISKLEENLIEKSDVFKAFEDKQLEASNLIKET